MAYDKEEIREQVLNLIKCESLVFFSDLEAFIEPTMKTLYDWEFHKCDNIKRALAINRINTKKDMRAKWFTNDNPTLQLAAYKLLANEDELERLNTNYNKNKTEVSGELGIVWNEDKTYEAEPKAD